MAVIMSYEKWIQLTEVSMKPRSAQLKAVDRSLQEYHKMPGESAKQNLRLALHSWKMKEGYDAEAGKPGWITSIRNRNRAVEALDLAVHGIHAATVESAGLSDAADEPFYGIQAYTPETARKYLEESQQQALAKFLTNTKVGTKSVSMGLFARSMTNHLKSAGENGGKVAAAAAKPATTIMKADMQKLALQLIEDVLGDYPVQVVQETIQTVLGLIPDLLIEIAASITPYVSFASSGSKALFNAYGAIKKQYQHMRVPVHMDAFRAGDAVAAVAALKRMIERQRDQYEAVAAMQGADAAVKAGAIIVDAAAHGIPVGSALFSSLSGMAKSIALLGLQIFLLGRDICEKHKANVELKTMTPEDLLKGAKIFEICPIVGCYFLTCSTDFQILNFSAEEIGSATFQFEVEMMLRDHVRPIRKFCYQAMNYSRLELTSDDPELANMLKYSKGVTAAALESYSFFGYQGIGRFKQKMRDTRGTRKKVEMAVKPMVDRIVGPQTGAPQLLPTVLKGQAGKPPALPAPPGLRRF
jgi:hypothetical protein